MFEAEVTCDGQNQGSQQQLSQLIDYGVVDNEPQLEREEHEEMSCQPDHPDPTNQQGRGHSSSLNDALTNDSDSFTSKFKIVGKYNNYNFKVGRFNIGVELTMAFNKDFKVGKFLEKIDELYGEVMDKVREENPYTDDAEYFITVSNDYMVKKFVMGKNTIGLFDKKELSRNLHKISQSGQDFIFRKFQLDVFVYDQGRVLDSDVTRTRPSHPEKSHSRIALGRIQT